MSLSREVPDPERVHGPTTEPTDHRLDLGDHESTSYKTHTLEKKKDFSTWLFLILTPVTPVGHIGLWCTV